jgi:glycosyltransferase involved in cell wall biosynthesis
LILEAAGKAAVVFTRSASLGKMLASAGADSGRVHPLHNGVDTECFRWRDQRGAREDLGVDEQTRIVLFVGNLLPVKDPNLLLEAFDCLRRNDRAGGWQLALAGKGPLRLDLEGKVRALGLASCVKFLGPLPAREIARWMNAADVLCLTSHNEGLPNVVLEAQASGIPVIVSDVGGPRDLVTNGQDGFVTKANDVADLANAIRQLADNPALRASMGEAGRRRVEDRDWSEAFEKFWNYSPE